MGTNTRPEISKNNEYWIERHRYYELRHFCLQYPIWKKAYRSLDGYSTRSASIVINTGVSTDVVDKTESIVESMLFFRNRMELIENAAFEASPELYVFLLKGVTEGLSFETMKTKMQIPCCKDSYYDIYRHFFWLLSKARN